MDTLQRVISIIEKEIAKNPAFMQKGIDPRNTNNSTVALITKEDLYVNSFQQKVSMMRRTTDQITDVSRGNTAALRWDRTVPLKLGTPTTIEDVHNAADMKYSVYPVVKIAARPKDRKK